MQKVDSGRVQNILTKLFFLDRVTYDGMETLRLIFHSHDCIHYTDVDTHLTSRGGKRVVEFRITVRLKVNLLGARKEEHPENSILGPSVNRA